MSSRTALIIIGTFKDEWWGLAPVAQASFVEQVGKITSAAGLLPLTGYRLAATPGAFLEVWEGANQAAVERAVKDLQAMGYTHYIEARWLIGERQIQGNGNRGPSVGGASRQTPSSAVRESPIHHRPQRPSAVRPAHGPRGRRERRSSKLKR